MQWKIQRATGDCQFEKVQTSGARVAPRAPYRNSVEGKHVIYIWINRKAAERVPFSISIASPKQKDQLKLRNWNSSRSSTMSTIIPNTGHPFADSSNSCIGRSSRHWSIIILRSCYVNDRGFTSFARFPSIAVTKATTGLKLRFYLLVWVKSTGVLLFLRVRRSSEDWWVEGFCKDNERGLNRGVELKNSGDCRCWWN